MMAPTLGKNLHPPVPTWSNDSASRQTKDDCRLDALVNFDTQDLVTKKVICDKKGVNMQMWALEMVDC